MTRAVGIGEMIVSTDPDDVLITYSLGSCVGLSLFDPDAVVGGLIHCMLPVSSLNPEKARLRPYLFVDTGVALLLQAVFDAGGEKRRMIAKVAGGAAPLGDHGQFRIGERNHTLLRRLLWKNDILVAAEDVGGTAARTLYLQLSTGRTVVRSEGRETEL